jgi:hypothetical protein
MNHLAAKCFKHAADSFRFWATDDLFVVAVG